MVFCLKSKYLLLQMKNCFGSRIKSNCYHVFRFIVFYSNQFILFYERVNYVRVTYQSLTICYNIIGQN